MKRTFEHKGLRGSIDIDDVEDVLYGRVLDIDSLVLYSGDSIRELRTAFVAAVDEYIADCRKLGIEPERPFGGTFNVRVGAEVHRAAARVAQDRGQSLNDFVRDALAFASGVTLPVGKPAANRRSSAKALPVREEALRTAASRKSVARKRAPR